MKTFWFCNHNPAIAQKWAPGVNEALRSQLDLFPFFQPNIDKLLETLEQLKSIGQAGAEDEVKKLEAQFDDLQTQAKEHRDKLQAAVALREQYYTAKGELETSLKDCSDQLDAVNAVGVAVSTKLDRYKTVVEEVNQMEPQFVQLENKAAEIGGEGTPSDMQAVQDHVQALRNKAESLKKRAESEAEEFQKVLSDRQDFTTGLFSCIDAMKTADLEIKPQKSLPLDTEGVETELNKYCDQKNQLMARVATMHEQCEEQKARYVELDEAMPLELTEQIEDFENLRENVVGKLNEQVSSLSRTVDADFFDGTIRSRCQMKGQMIKFLVGTVTQRRRGTSLTSSFAQTPRKSTVCEKKPLHADVVWSHVDKLFHLPSTLVEPLLN